MEKANAIILQNRISAVYWIFAVVYNVFVATMGYILMSQGPPDGFTATFSWSAWGVFFTGGIGVAAWAFRRPVYTIVRTGESITVTERRPFRRNTRVYTTGDIAAISIEMEKDSDGDRYYVALLKTSDGRVARLAEGHFHDIVERAVSKFHGRI